MPWAVRIDSKQRVSYATLLGIVTFQDIVAMRTALVHEPDFDPSAPLLVDMREAEDLRLTWLEFQHVIEHSPLLDDTRRATVVDALNVLGTARVFEMAREKQVANHSLRVVQTVEDAAEWCPSIHSLTAPVRIRRRGVERRARACCGRPSGSAPRRREPRSQI